MVLEIPEEHEDEEGSEDPCEALVAFSSLQECHRVVMAESVCQPRKVLYMGFLLLAPALILLFAFT